MIQEDLDKLKISQGLSDSQMVAVRKLVLDTAFFACVDSKVRDDLEEILDIDISQ